MPQARFSQQRTKGDMLKFQIHSLRRKQFASKLVSSKKVMLSHTAVTAIFIQNTSLWDTSKPTLSIRRDWYRNIVCLFNDTQPFKSKPTRKKGFFSNVTCLPDTRRTDAFKFEWTRTREQHMRGSPKYPLHPRSTIPRTSLGRFPEEVESGYTLREDRSGAASLSVLFPGDSVKLHTLPRLMR